MRLHARLPVVCAVVCLVIVSILARAQSSYSLTIYAATSLTDAFEELAADFVEMHPEVDVVLNFASSSTLAAQLLLGAQADIFASANEARMDQIVGDGLIEAKAVEVFARNQLVLAIPADNPAQIESVVDLAEKSALLVLAVQGTPIRVYTDAMFQSYGTEFGEDFAERVLENLVSEESNVRQVVTRVALGEADVGIVYQTDVIGEVSEQLITIPIDQEHNQLASYPIAILDDVPQKKLARSFVDFVLSDQGQSILRYYGFCPPESVQDEPAETPTPVPDENIDAQTEVEITPCGQTATAS